MTKEVNDIRTQLLLQLPLLQKKYPIAKLALFGSVVRDDFDPINSDIDIMVEFNGAIGWEFIDLSDELEKLLGKKVDLVSRGGIKPRYWEHIKADIVYV
ncbi:MAG TPA: nucleotidyltransferase family protein [Bacteroidia bacterium]|jgi:predicted nucleotidyltransferase|nr:nucleotidyltransferase family protein [Bacteroidia bacterium]